MFDWLDLSKTICVILTSSPFAIFVLETEFSAFYLRKSFKNYWISNVEALKMFVNQEAPEEAVAQFLILIFASLL